MSAHRFPYSAADRGGKRRPYLYIRLENAATRRITPLLPVIVDTGSDWCMFKAALAHEIGINPVHGGDPLDSRGVGGRATMYLYPLRMHVPQLGWEYEVRVQLGQLAEGINGVLGHAGFIGRMSRACFYPKSEEFELVPRPDLAA